MTDLSNAINYNQIFELLTQLSLCIYTPSNYIFPSKIAKYIDLTHNKGNNLTQQGREQGIRRLMSINLLKRLESSVYSFHLTLTRILDLITGTIKAIDDFEKYGSTDYFIVGKKVKINLTDMDYKTWRSELQQDAENLELLTLMVADITPEHDLKLQKLLGLLDEKMHSPINAGNRKVLTCFSPISKGQDVLMPGSTKEIDILIATDCISEGQNLQDCDYLVNYDIHWNPVRIIQRFGRIDRIGSKNKVIQLVNFWPDMTLDEYINLKSWVETRMKISVMTSTGDDDLINSEEKGDLEYRKQQLKRLQEEVVDMEDMSTGISIMDLGLNEFRLGLLDYIKNHGDLAKKPKGLHAVVPATEENPEGVIFVLRNINNSVNIDNQNRIHPFYMVYISVDGEVVCDYLNPKKLLDTIRLLCRGKSEPLMPLCAKFNEETDDGRNMKEVSQLLSDAINSIIDVKEKSDIDSLFSAGGTSALMNAVSGLDDFELICFLVVK